MAQPYRARAYVDFDCLLQNDIDALFVCIPPFAHAGQEIRAAERGIHLFVSKPVSIDLAYAQRVSEAIARYDVISSVSFMLRYCTPVERAKELLRDRHVGLVRGHVLARMIDGQRGWYFRKTQSGGQMVVQSGHLFDVFRYLLGEMEEVYAVGSTELVPRSADYDIEDASIALLRFACGAIGSISSTVAMPPGFKEDMAFEIVADDLHLGYSLHQGILHIRDQTGSREYERTMRGREGQKVAVGVFLNAVRSGDGSRIRSPYEDAMRSLQVALLADESMKRGQPMRVPAPG